MTSIPDPYKVLQVDPEAEDEVIEAAYRRLARKYHPDVAPGPEAQERMVRINQAWEMLRTPSKRAAVDRARARSSGAAARVAAAEARSRAAAHSPVRPRPPAGHSRVAADPVSSATGSAYGPVRGAPSGFPGVAHPGDAAFRNRTQFVSPDWTNGRSHTGYGYEPASMGAPSGEGAAGPPPGSPSGSVLNFGRYAGWSLGEIARTDLEYLEWLDRTPIGRTYQSEIDHILRSYRRRQTAPREDASTRGLFRRR